MAFGGSQGVHIEGSEFNDIGRDSYKYTTNHYAGPTVNNIGDASNVNFGTNYGSIVQLSGDSPPPQGGHPGMGPVPMPYYPPPHMPFSPQYPGYYGHPPFGYYPYPNQGYQGGGWAGQESPFPPQGPYDPEYDPHYGPPPFAQPDEPRRSARKANADPTATPHHKKRKNRTERRQPDVEPPLDQNEMDVDRPLQTGVDGGDLPTRPHPESYVTQPHPPAAGPQLQAPRNYRRARVESVSDEDDSDTPRRTLQSNARDFQLPMSSNSVPPAAAATDQSPKKNRKFRDIFK